MAFPGRRSVVMWFALLVAAWTVFALLSGVETGLLYLAPALLLCVPLLFGRYLGEEQLAALARSSSHCTAPRAAGPPPPAPPGRRPRRPPPRSQGAARAPRRAPLRRVAGQAPAPAGHGVPPRVGT